jgi:uncharacterized membrane protein YgdD (TMEM256/DUF423 family)
MTICWRWAAAPVVAPAAAPTVPPTTAPTGPPTTAFAGDLSMRALKSTALFPMAAPAGGIGLMVGWGLLAVSALIPRA